MRNTSRALKSANIRTLKNYFNQIPGTDISQFFKDYIGGPGLQPWQLTQMGIQNIL